MKLKISLHFTAEDRDRPSRSICLEKTSRLDLTLAQTTLAHGCLGPYIRANFSLGPISFWPKSHFGQSDFDPGQFGPWTLGPKDILALAYYGPLTFGPMDVRAHGP